MIIEHKLYIGNLAKILSPFVHYNDYIMDLITIYEVYRIKKIDLTWLESIVY